MLSRSITTILTLAVMLVFASATLAQDRSVARAAPNPDAPFDPRDFSGIWERNGGSRGISRRPGDDTTPPMTPEGQARFDSYRPGYGPRQVPPATGNDPTGECNPAGLTRALLYPRPTQFIQTPDLLVQMFSWHRVFREIWTDGRELPENFNPDLRRWYGYSAGRWEDNTLVVESAGFDDRAWLDQNGYPLSEATRVVERYTRVDHDTIELEMTITDPLTYTRPWVAEQKSYRLVPREEVVAWYARMTDLQGWYGVFEEDCAPVDEVDNFNSRVRDPAAGL